MSFYCKRAIITEKVRVSPVLKKRSSSEVHGLAPAQVTPRTGLMNWNSKRMMIIGAVALVAAVPALAQNPDLQEKLAAVKQSTAENSRSSGSISGSKQRSSL